MSRRTQPAVVVVWVLVVVGALGAAVRAQAASPGANGRIAYVQWVVDQPEIYTANADGTDPENLTESAAYEYEPAWSPAGTRIAFARGTGDDFDLFVMNADGTGVAQLTSGPEIDREPAWSPDGVSVAFVRGPTGAGEIYVVRIDGSGLTNLTRSATDDGSPAWSPDGRRIAFTRGEDIHVMNADGSGRRTLTRNAIIEQNPDWSPDGTRLAFDRIITDAEGFPIREQLHVKDMRTLRTRRVAFGYDPAWSPDGRLLAVTRGQDIPETGVIDLDRPADFAPVAAGDGAFSPSWQPLTDLPVNLVAPAIAGTVRAGSLLRAQVGRWAGKPELAYAVAWELCSPDGGTCRPIAGASGAALEIPSGRSFVGRALRVRVTASNQLGSATVASEPTGPVGAVIVGASGRPEVFLGTAGPDLVRGAAEDDRLSGAAGDDVLLGGLEDDVLRGGRGNDRLVGGDGNDRLIGGPGRDRLLGGDGDDRIFARDGAQDVIRCGAGLDRVSADRLDLVARSCEAVGRR